MTRIPKLNRDEMDEEQARIYDATLAGSGRVGGPALAYVYSPKLWEAVNAVTNHFQNCSLTHAQTRIAALVTARHFNSAYPWSVQAPHALNAGVDRAEVDAINEGRRPDLADPVDALVHDMAVELLKTARLSDATYEKAVEMLGHQRLVDAVGVVGYFSLVGMMANAVDVTPSADAPVPLKQ